MAVVCAALFATGCGSDSAGSAFEGIFATNTWTENDNGCDTEGPSILANASQTTFYIKKESFFGAKFLNLNFCDDVADCDALASEPNTINLGRLAFEDGDDDAGWSSGWYSGFPDGNDLCAGDVAEHIVAWMEARVR